MVDTTPAPSGAGFRHRALVYEGDAAFLDGTVPFVRAGLERDEAVLVAVSPEKIGWMRDALAADAGSVEFMEMNEVGRNPGRILPVWRTFVNAHAGSGRGFRGIGEPVWPGRTEAELVECRQHEALLNLAFDGGPGWELLCPYDGTTLPPDVLATARRTHPGFTDGRFESVSDSYRGHEDPRVWFSDPLPDPPPDATTFLFTMPDLAELRRRIEHRADRLGLQPGRRDDLTLAVDEVASNSVRFGGGSGICRIWHESDRVVCEIRDAGHIDDLLVGREPPTTGQIGGRGLWLANQLCDLVQIRTGVDGTVVRLQIVLETPSVASPPDA